MAQRRTAANRDVALAIARERFGYRELRDGQREAIEFVLADRDTLAVMPTGAGKSAIYQIPAVALPGPTVVVSPLIALQKDQAETLSAQDAGGAAVMNSATRAAVRKEIFRDFEGGDLEFLFVTPEQLAKPNIIGMIAAAGPSLFVVDEAHCISEWGHDFRPEYLKLGDFIETLGHPRTLALTATAGEHVRREIIERLRLRDPAVIVQGFDRPNIHLSVETFQKPDEKLDALLKRIAWADKPGIVYVATRKHTEEISAALCDRGVNAFGYHGGMNAKDRAPVQEEFMADKYDVIVATSAFGMGIDKSNVRFVYHYDVPHSLDSYYQEIGRAGRDGERAEAILFYRREDLGLHKFFAGGSKIDEETIQKFARAYELTQDPAELKKLTGLSKAKIARLLVKSAEYASAQDAAASITTEEARVHASELERIDNMRAYAEMLECRRGYLLRYFGGGDVPDSCGRCDNCERTGAAAA